MSALGEAIVNCTARAKDAQLALGAWRECVLNRLRKRGIVVRSVVVNEQDLVVAVGEYLRYAVDAERGALVQVVAVAVIASVKNDGNHRDGTGARWREAPGRS